PNTTGCSSSRIATINLIQAEEPHGRAFLLNFNRVNFIMLSMLRKPRRHDSTAERNRRNKNTHRR
ncbi:MAG: hypothetical protein AB7S54_12635, partial [Bacteroidales bacterium]